MSVFDKAIRIEELTKAKKEIETEINVLKREVFAEAPAWLENPYVLLPDIQSSLAKRQQD